jgi:hypothetical protein
MPNKLDVVCPDGVMPWLDQQSLEAKANPLAWFVLRSGQQTAFKFGAIPNDIGVRVRGDLDNSHVMGVAAAFLCQGGNDPRKANWQLSSFFRLFRS